MENNHYPVWKQALNFGLILSLAMILLSLLWYILDLSTNKAVGYVGYAVLLAGIIISEINYRDRKLGGYITYGKSLSTGFLTGLFASIIVGIYTFIYFTVIAPEMVDILIRAAEDNMIEKSPDLTDDQLDMAMNMTRKMMTPLGMSFWATLSNIFFSLIFALIVSIFVRKDPNTISEA